MTREILDCSSPYAELVSELISSIQVRERSGTFNKFTFPQAWDYAGNMPEDPYKITAINRSSGIFIKTFAPITRD